MMRFCFIVGAGVGYVLGARAGRERYEQIAELTDKAMKSDTAQRAGVFAQHQLDAASVGIANLTGQLQEQSKDLGPRLVHTAESLREDLTRRASELGEQIDHAVARTGEAVARTGEQINQAVSRTGEQLDHVVTLTGEQIQKNRERIGEQVQHNRERIDEQVSKNLEMIDAVVENTRERIDGVAERNRDKQLQEVVDVSTRRDDSLDSLETEHDVMIDEARADERNRDE